ncbi:transposase (plasmid) [Antarctobacter heliothermus]|uniref:Transposase n=1 Tax=Antarctobacter heliothermus TaxID=74033 RepID=A0A222EAT9_9RHOB|nr:transposase [Antarctobacter heliothermus]
MELRLAGISDMEAGNAFLLSFVERYNAKFAKAPRRPDNLHRTLNIEPVRLRDILCLRDERYVSQQLAFSYARRRIIFEENDVTRGLPGKYMDSYEFPDGRLEFRWKGVSLPYSTFDKDQRVTHAATTENQNLSAVLEFIKEEQDKAPPKKPRAGKQRARYEPTRRKSPGRPSKLDAYYARKHAEREASAAGLGCDM